MKIADQLNNIYEAQVDMRDLYQRDDLEVKFEHIANRSDELLDSLMVSKDVGKIQQQVSEIGSSARAIIPNIKRRKTLRGFTQKEFKVIDKAFNDVGKASIVLAKMHRKGLNTDKITNGQVGAYLKDVLYYMQEIKPIMVRFNMLASN